jgi:hypothetical protein
MDIKCISSSISSELPPSVILFVNTVVILGYEKIIFN